MNGVIGMTNLLMGTDLTARQLEYLKIAQASGNALVTLINEVLDLSKIEAGKMELESVPFDLRMEVDDVLCLFEEVVHQKDLEVCALVHHSIPKLVVGDPGRLRQILINLVSNAIKVFILLSTCQVHYTIIISNSTANQLRNVAVIFKSRCPKEV
jgi:histidine kinase 2/3/4 (cytokinin receptor)